MSQSLSIASVIEANRLSSSVPFLALIDVDVVNPDTGVIVMTLHFVNNGDDVIFQGELYKAAKFDIQVKQESGKQAEVSLNVVDYTQALQAPMEEYGGGIGFNVTFYVVNADELQVDPEMVLYFQIIGAQASGYTQSYQLGAENTLMLTFPRRRQTRDFCQRRFKSIGEAQCNYTGPLTSCDLTLKGPNGCQVHGNTINFGAFPGLNGNGYRYA